MNRKEITIEYTNYKGRTAIRRIVPEQIVFSSNQWHPEPQWLLEAYDCDKNASRTFALKHIHTWIAE